MFPMHLRNYARTILTQNDQIWQGNACGEGHISRVSHALIPRGLGPSVTKFLRQKNADARSVCGSYPSCLPLLLPLPLTDVHKIKCKFNLNELVANGQACKY